MAASTRPSRWCSRPPARPSRTRTTAWANPPACRVPRPRWSTRTAAIPGLCWCRKASTTAACRQPWAAASSACPSKPWRMTPPKTTDRGLHAAGARRQRRVSLMDWNMEDPVCSGTGDTVKQASYLIKEAVPTIKFSGTVYNDKNGNDALDEQENWTSVEPSGLERLRQPRAQERSRVVAGGGARRGQLSVRRAQRYGLHHRPVGLPANPSPRPRSTGVSRARRPAFSAPIPKARTHRTSA